jgi:hypothetical protein
MIHLFALEVGPTDAKPNGIGVQTDPH